MKMLFYTFLVGCLFTLSLSTKAKGGQVRFSPLVSGRGQMTSMKNSIQYKKTYLNNNELLPPSYPP